MRRARSILRTRLPRWVEEGARLIGGDYGTRPEHIAAMAAVARELKPVRVKKISVATTKRARVEVTDPANRGDQQREEESFHSRPDEDEAGVDRGA